MIVAATAREQTRARYPDEEGYVERDGVRVYYEVYGAGEPTVFLLPTWSIIHSRQWKFQIPYLARHFRVLTFDGRGNGRSDRPDEPTAYAEREFAADAVAIMDATGTDKALVVGLSLGAQRALILATDHPARVVGLVFLGPVYPGGGERLAAQLGVNWEDELESYEGWAKYNKHYWLRDYEDFLEFLFSRDFNEPHSAKAIEDCIGWARETTPETLVTAGYGKKLSPDEARALAERVRCPVLVIHGKEDELVSWTRGAALADHTRGRLVLFEEFGHAPHIRAPVKVNLLVREFVASLTTGRA